MLEACSRQVEIAARSGPVLMMLEDAHWIDPTSLQVLGRTVECIAALRVLLIVTCRSDFKPPWIDDEHVRLVTINRLARRQVDALIDRLIGDNALPAGVRQSRRACRPR